MHYIIKLLSLPNYKVLEINMSLTDPIKVRDAPRFVTTNKGSIPNIISVEKSVKKLTIPNATTLRIPDFSDLGGSSDKSITYPLP